MYWGQDNQEAAVIFLGKDNSELKLVSQTMYISSLPQMVHYT